MERNDADLVKDSLLYRQPMQTLKDGCHVFTSASIPLRAWQQHWEPSAFAEWHHPTHRKGWHCNSRCDWRRRNGQRLFRASVGRDRRMERSCLSWKKQLFTTLFTWSSIVSLQSIMTPRSADGVERRDFGAFESQDCPWRSWPTADVSPAKWTESCRHLTSVDLMTSTDWWRQCSR